MALKHGMENESVLFFYVPFLSILSINFISRLCTQKPKKGGQTLTLCLLSVVCFH